MNLYFIAIIPDEGLRARVKSLKEEMRESHGAKHALKSPAHITLVPPFRRSEEHERFVTDALRRFAAGRKEFDVRLSGFNSFAPRVIYIDVLNPDPLKKLYPDLKKFLLDEMLFTAEELKNKFHPHMTIATRDLTKEAFQKAWPEFEKREFETNFDVRSIFLLKHNGKFWDICKEFDFAARTDA